MYLIDDWGSGGRGGRRQRRRRRPVIGGASEQVTIGADCESSLEL